MEGSPLWAVPYCWAPPGAPSLAAVGIGLPQDGHDVALSLTLRRRPRLLQAARPVTLLGVFSAVSVGNVARTRDDTTRALGDPASSLLWPAPSQEIENTRNRKKYGVQGGRPSSNAESALGLPLTAARPATRDPPRCPCRPGAWAAGQGSGQLKPQASQRPACPSSYQPGGPKLQLRGQSREGWAEEWRGFLP